MFALGNDPTIPIEENPGRQVLQQVWAGIYLFLFTFIFMFRNSLYLAFRQQFWIIVLALYLPLTMLWSSAPNVTLQSGIILGLGTIIGGYIGTRFHTEQIFQLLKYPMIIGLFGSFILVFFVPDLGLMKGIEHNGLWKGGFTHKNATGQISLFAAIVFLFVYRNNIYIMVPMVALALLMVFGARSSTSFIALTTLIAVYLMRRPLSVRGTDVFIVICGSLAVATIAGFILLINLEDFFGLFGKDLTLTGRTLLWEYGFKAFLAKPIFGFGFDAFWYDTGQYGGLAIRAIAGWNAPGIHNGWLELLLSVGLVGTFLFGAIFFQLMQRCYYLMRVLPLSVYFYTMMFCICLLVYSISEGVFLLRNSLTHVLLIAFAFSTYRELHEVKFSQNQLSL